MSAKVSRSSSGSVPWPGGASAAPVRGAVLAWANLACLTLLLLAAGCRLDMHVQPRYNPYDPSGFFSDGRSARQPVAGTVPRSANIAELADSAGGANAGAFP